MFKKDFPFAVVLALVFFFQWGSAAVEDPSYALSPWPYGAIAWVGELPDNYQTQSWALAAAVTDVFQLWELPPLTYMVGWENPAGVEPAWKTGDRGPIPQMFKKDAATGEMWRLNPLMWEDMYVYSLLYIAFPSRTLLAQALGTTAIGGVWIYGNRAYRESAVWLQALTGVPMSIVAPFTDGMIIAWHEIAHWMTFLVCERDAVPFCRLPEFIVEGIAEYSSAQMIQVDGWKHTAAAWAETNALSVQMDSWATYRIGHSVVLYLVETQGATAFLDSLAEWASAPEARIRHIEPGWHAWLGID